MKKIAIALAVSLAITVAAPAYATQVIMKDGKLSGGFTIHNGDASKMNPAANAEVKLAVQAEEEGGWSAEAELGNLIGTPALGKYKVELYDPLFRVIAWGKDKETSDKKDPFEFIKSVKKHTGTLKTRVEVGPVTTDLDDNGNLYLFGEQVVGNHTLGVAAHNNLPLSNGISAVGYGKTKFASVDLTGAVGMTMKAGVSDQNIGLGLKAEAPVAPSLTAAVSYKSQPANFIGNKNTNSLAVEGKHETDVTKGTASFTHAVNAANGNFVSDVIEAQGNWRGSSANQAWDDQFKSDKYFKNVAPAVQAKVKQTRDNSNPATELAVKGTMPVIPERLWVNGSLASVVDEDGTLSTKVRNLADSGDIVFAGAKRHMTLQADGYFMATDKLTLEPGAVYLSASNVADATYLKLGSKASYQVAANGKVTAEYVKDYLNKNANDSRLGLGYEVKF